MEWIIAIFLGAYLLAIGILCFIRTDKDFKGDKEQ